MKLDREHIEKALRCCAGDIILCQKCAYSKNGYHKCKEEAAKDALALIRDLEKEKTALEKELSKAYNDLEAAISFLG